MRRPLFVLLATVVAGCLAFPAGALGLRAQVRVEGAKTTIFGTAQPAVTAFTGTLVAEDGTEVELDEPTALGALEAASRRGEFFYRLVATSFGPFVSQIGSLPGQGASGWVYKVNGASPPVGADVYVLEEGDEVLWYYATFGPTGGPLTLDLERAGRRCFQAYEVDDNGARVQARDVVFRIGNRSVEDGDGRICPRGHWHRLKVTKPGLVRSETVVR